MPYVLSFDGQEENTTVFDHESDAIAHYEAVLFDTGDHFHNAKLTCTERNTFVSMFPGITGETVTSELETVCEWAPEDRLKIRPVLKERYRTKT